MTWHKARSISSGLTPQLLVTSGLDRPERPDSRGAAAGGPGPGAPPTSPSPTETQQASRPGLQHAPASVEEAERQPVQQPAAANGGSNESSSQPAQDSQLPLGATQGTQGGKASTTVQPGSSFPERDIPQASFNRTDRQTEAPGSATDQAGSSAEQSELSQPAASSQLHSPQDATTLPIPASDPHSDPPQGQSSRPDPPQSPSSPPRLERLSPQNTLDIHTTMSSEPSSHKLSALEERYATGVPLTADEAFNRALQQQSQRQNSWGSNTSASSTTNPAGASATPALGDVPDRVSSSRLLATIHSGIPSTDDDGPLFAELGKLVAEEEAEAEAAGQGRGQDVEVDLNQVRCRQQASGLRM